MATPEPLSNLGLYRFGRPVERLVLLVGGFPHGEQEKLALGVVAVDLGAAIAADVEVAFAGAGDMAGELAIDVVAVGAGDHYHVDVQLQQVLQGARHHSGVGLAVLHRGAVPVESDYAESLAVHTFSISSPRRR